MAWPVWRAGTARPSATIRSPSPSIRWSSRSIVAHIQPGVEARWRLAALLHDAPEYVIGDMISPFKAALGLDYRSFEERLEAAIHIRFGLPARVPAPVKTLIKQADRACAYFEATQLAGFGRAEALKLFGRPPPGYTLQVEPLSPRDAQERYLLRCQVLTAAGASARPARPSTPNEPVPVSVSVVIGLSAVVVALRDGEACVLTVRPRDDAPRGHRPSRACRSARSIPRATAPSNWRCASS